MLQVAKTGKPAKCPTREEWLYVMRLIKEEAERRLVPNHPDIFTADRPVLYSFDNDSKHNCPDKLQALGIQRLPVPPHCSDLQKVIEHSHGTLQTAFEKALQADPQLKTMQQFVDKLHDLFYEVITTESVRKDVEHLKPMYQAILAPVEQNGTDGDFAPKKLS